MKAINIFALTRTNKCKYIRRYDKQLSGRKYYLPVKDWEIDGLRQLADMLCTHQEDYDKMCFFYSFQIPKLGKEFDLLQISTDKVLNIELKSQIVSDEKIKKQLILNKQYLALLGKDVYSFTYISEANRLVRLTHGGRLVEASPEELRQLLHNSEECVLDDVEGLFGEEKYLISPLTDPDRFLRKDYFLTSQQRDIRNKIVKQIEEGRKKGEPFRVQGFTGLPGTGKTLLLYDLALHFSEKQKVFIVHFGAFIEEMKRLDDILKRIDFVSAEELFARSDDCALICVDEGHRMTADFWTHLQAYAKEKKIPVVISYDDESAICPDEREHKVNEVFEAVPGYVKYELTNRIRTNARLSVFIRNIVHLAKGIHRRELPEIQLVYADDAKQREWYIKDFVNKGYVYIPGEVDCETNGLEMFSREYERVVMVADHRLYYDAQGYLREEIPSNQDTGKQLVGRLFHGLNRAKKGLAIVVQDNEPLFETMLSILQGEE